MKKIFISSVIKGYQDRRDAAEKAINNLRHDLNLDLRTIRLDSDNSPSLGSSSQQACLDGVNSCDIYIGIYPKSLYGWDKSPVGISPTHEEYREARKNKKIILIFVESLKEGEIEDLKQNDFLKEVGDYISGSFWNEFSDLKDLEHKVYRSLVSLLSNKPVDTIKENLKFQTQNRIQREKNLKKYIPEVFTEIPHAKDELRIFTDPVLFLQKIVEDLQKIDIYSYNEMLSKLGVEALNIELPVGFQKPSTIKDAINGSNLLKEYVKELIRHLELMDPYKERAFLEFLNGSNTFLFNEIKHLIWTHNSSIRWKLESIERHLNLIASQIIIIEGKAASGKTNFVCNFADTTLKCRKQLSFYVTGYDLPDEGIISLKKYIVNCFNDSYSGNTTDLLSYIEKICLKDNKPLIIIIDGINEHPHINDFRFQLEKLIEEFTRSPYVKFILTCRSEYFEERFSNLKTASFNEKTMFIEDLTRGIPTIHKKYMIYSYFKRYNIECCLNNDVRDRFVENPLILRLFCDVYGNSEGDEIVYLEPVYDIRFYDLFSKYNEKIIEIFEKKYPESGFKRKYKKLLQELAKYMLTHSIFSNVPLSSISDELENIITILVNEGVILKKDLPEKASIFDDSEVLNFTYDEFRDFILADFLIQKIAPTDFSNFKEYYSKCVSPESQVAEGIGKYIFTIVRNENNIQIEEFLKSNDNYDDLFLRNIFSLNDSLIVEDDIEKIKSLFHYNSRNAYEIYINLVNRRNKSYYPNLNIWLFLDFVSRLNKIGYDRLISPALTPYLDDICKGIKNTLKERESQDLEREEYCSLLELLLCLSPIISPRFKTNSSLEVFFEIANKNVKLSAHILEIYTGKQTPLVSQILLTVLFQIAKTSFIDEQEIFIDC